MNKFNEIPEDQRQELCSKVIDFINKEIESCGYIEASSVKKHAMDLLIKYHIKELVDDYESIYNLLYEVGLLPSYKLLEDDIYKYLDKNYNIYKSSGKFYYSSEDMPLEEFLEKYKI